jgi:hypothetical protein
MIFVLFGQESGSLQREPRIADQTPLNVSIAYGYLAKPRHQTPARDARGILAAASSSGRSSERQRAAGSERQRRGEQAASSNLRRQQATASSELAAAAARSECGNNERKKLPACTPTHPLANFSCSTLYHALPLVLAAALRRAAPPTRSLVPRCAKGHSPCRLVPPAQALGRT